MFGHRSFLMIGDTGAADIMSLIKGGPEVQNCNFSFNQNVDDKGRATTRVYSGILNITLSQLPPQNIIEWALNSKKYSDGMIVMVDAENVPLEKIYFEEGTCTKLRVSYSQEGKSYATTHLTIQAAKLIVGSGIDFQNDWTKY